MKHTFLQTLELAFWSVLTIGFGIGLLMAGFVFEVSTETWAPSSAVIYMIAAIIVGAVLSFWWLSAKIPGAIRIIMGLIGLVGIVYLIARVFFKVALFAFPGLSEWGLGAFSVLAGLVFVVAMYDIAHKKNMDLALRCSNVVWVVVIGASAGLFVQYLNLFWAIVLLALVAVYDAVAVWKLGSMQMMAKGFIDGGFVPGMAVPKRPGQESNEYGMALIGNGDLFFIILLGGVLFKSGSTVLFVGGLFGMVGALIALLFSSSKNKSYPAIPFIFAGLLVGLGIGVLFS